MHADKLVFHRRRGISERSDLFSFCALFSWSKLSLFDSGTDMILISRTVVVDTGRYSSGACLIGLQSLTHDFLNSSKEILQGETSGISCQKEQRLVWMTKALRVISNSKMIELNYFTNDVEGGPTNSLGSRDIWVDSEIYKGR